MNTKRWNRRLKLTAASMPLIALLITSTPTALAEGPFELVPHENDVYGIRMVQDGEYEKAVERLKTQLGGERQAHAKRTPVLIDLCVAYTMLREFGEAEQYCNKAVEAGWYQGLALNNRGVMKIARGDYEGGIADFQSATAASGAKAVGQRNLERAQQTLAARQAEQSNRLASIDVKRAPAKQAVKE